MPPTKPSKFTERSFPGGVDRPADGRVRAAFCHDWLNGMRGGEKCLEALAELFPGSPIFTLFYEKGRLSPAIESHPIRVSSLQSIPGARTRYRSLLPFYPWAVERFDFSEFDLIVSTSHCVAKGARRPKGAVHVSYCFTPMRYAWGFFDEYFGNRGPLSKAIIRSQLSRLRDWDRRSSERVDHFVAISEHVKKRIQEFYGRDADVVYPPADTDFYSFDGTLRGEHYLVVSALVPYKRVDLAVDAFNANGKPLVVIGEGPERGALERRAKSNIRFLGWQSDEALRDAYRRARALIFPGEEDFGIVPVEAQACGLPVVAYGLGGALETVVDGRTGVFFKTPDIEALNDAVARLERIWPRAEDARANAVRFSRSRFQTEMRLLLAARLARPGGTSPSSGGLAERGSGARG